MMLCSIQKLPTACGSGIVHGEDVQDTHQYSSIAARNDYLFSSRPFDEIALSLVSSGSQINAASNSDSAVMCDADAAWDAGQLAFVSSYVTVCSRPGERMSS